MADTAPATVRFSEEPPAAEEKVPAAPKRRVVSRRERRDNAVAQQRAQEDAKIRLQENLELIKTYADQLTPEALATELKQYVSEEPEMVSGVPNNGRAPFSPMSYCSDCVDRIAAYFKDENMAKDGAAQVYIKDIRKLATLFLDVQNLHFYDHVAVEAFNDNAMKRGGSTYGVPLSLACLADSDNLYEKLAGKEAVCAAFSTGLAMQCELTVSSENSFKTHGQLLEENVDLTAIRSGCSCFKSDGWLKERVKMKRLMQKMSLEELMNKNWNWGDGDEQEDQTEEEKVVEEEDFRRPGNLPLPVVEKEEDFDNERWSHMRTTSSCLALCRHAPSCVVNATNKARVMESLTLVRLPEGEKEGAASTTPGEYFTVIARPDSCLMFSLGATVYEALAYQCHDLWNDETASSVSSGEKALPRRATAKVYTTVHTVAAPFFRSAPLCHIDHQNKYGYYRTFRIRLPGNFSGHYNDTSIGWRSALYSCITSSAAETEGRGDKKSHYPFLVGYEGFVAWPRLKPIRVERGIVYDDSGDMSGNYLTFGTGGVVEKTAVPAHANMRNLTAAIKTLKESIAELLTVPFKTQLVELKTLDLERTQADTAHETQRLNDVHTNMTQNAIFTAQTIESYEKCLRSLERDLGTMNKYLSYNLEDYTATAAAAAASHNDVFDYYL